MREVTISIPSCGITWGESNLSEVTFLVGQNARDNHNILDLSKPTDIWFHVRDYASCHVIANIPTEVLEIDDRRKRRDIMRRITKQGCVICKRFSKYANDKNVEIMSTPVNNVEKTLIEGEVVTRGSYSTTKI